MYSLKKHQRVKSREAEQLLFAPQWAAKRKSLAVYPLRLVYTIGEGLDTPSGNGKAQEKSKKPSNVQVLFSVSKRHFHHATDRNRAKRQMREAVRLRLGEVEQFLLARLSARERLLIALIWLSDDRQTTAKISKSVNRLFDRLQERL